MNRIACTITVLFGLFTLFIACSKKVEKEEPCRILGFEKYEKKWNGEYDTITAKFSYDSQDRLTSIIFNKNETGRPNYHFRYDKEGRLIWLAGLWPTSKSFDYIHKFKYVGNTIVSDSFFFSGADTSDLFHLTWNLFLGKYAFDPLNRLSEYDYDIYFPMNPAATPVHDNIKYAYDANGNLIRSGGTFTYDDKVNFLSTDPVLQLLNRDYSVNNPVPAISYNKHGLPLVFDHTLPYPFNKGRFMNIGANKIDYSCD